MLCFCINNILAYFSRFIFRNPASEEEEEEAEEEEKAAYHKSDEETYYKGPQLDDDGDLVLPQKQTICSEVVYLGKSTEFLNDVSVSS